MLSHHVLSSCVLSRLVTPRLICSLLASLPLNEHTCACAHEGACVRARVRAHGCSLCMCMRMRTYGCRCVCVYVLKQHIAAFKHTASLRKDWRWGTWCGRRMAHSRPDSPRKRPSRVGPAATRAAFIADAFNLCDTRFMIFELGNGHALLGAGDRRDRAQPIPTQLPYQPEIVGTPCQRVSFTLSSCLVVTKASCLLLKSPSS